MYYVAIKINNYMYLNEILHLYEILSCKKETSKSCNHNYTYIYNANVCVPTPRVRKTIMELKMVAA